MSKLKDLIIDVCDDYDEGLSIFNISKIHNIPVIQVTEILEYYSQKYISWEETYMTHGTLSPH